MSNKICAITGSNGYVGGCLKSYFAARGWKMLDRKDGYGLEPEAK